MLGAVATSVWSVYALNRRDAVPVDAITTGDDDE